MDARRFDSLTRRLGARRSRRAVVRSGAGVVLTAAIPALPPLALAQDAATTATDRFVALFFYPFEGDFNEAETALKPLIREMQQQPGFITLAFIEDDAALYLVTTFLDKTTSAAGTKVLEDWIAANGAKPGVVNMSLGGAAFSTLDAAATRLIAGLSVVVNYDLPRSAADYTHRIGRTARAGAAGLEVSFVSAQTESHFRLIEKRQGQRVPRQRIEGFEPRDVAPAGPPSTGGVKGRRRSRKDRLREAAAATAATSGNSGG